MATTNILNIITIGNAWGLLHPVSGLVVGQQILEATLNIMDKPVGGTVKITKTVTPSYAAGVGQVTDQGTTQPDGVSVVGQVRFDAVPTDTKPTSGPPILNPGTKYYYNVTAVITGNLPYTSEIGIVFTDLGGPTDQ